MYDIVSSPNKDSTKLTLKLSRVKSNESDPSGKFIFVTFFIFDKLSYTWILREFLFIIILKQFLHNLKSYWN